jgi:hypothetical protein
MPVFCKSRGRYTDFVDVLDILVHVLNSFPRDKLTPDADFTQYMKEPVSALSDLSSRNPYEYVTTQNLFFSFFFFFFFFGRVPQVFPSCAKAVHTSNIHFLKLDFLTIHTQRVFFVLLNFLFLALPDLVPSFDSRQSKNHRFFPSHSNHGCF